MKVRFDKIGYPLYCDAGPYEGDMRIDLNIRLYLCRRSTPATRAPKACR